MKQVRSLSGPDSRLIVGGGGDSQQEIYKQWWREIENLPGVQADPANARQAILFEAGCEARRRAKASKCRNLRSTDAWPMPL